MATLINAIMEGTIYSKNNSSIDISNYDFSKQITLESESLNQAIVTCFSEIMEADKMFLTSEVGIVGHMLRAQKVGESYDQVSVLEGVFGDFINRIIESIKKFWAKIVEWFKKTIEFFKAMFSNARDFAKKYGKELKDKKTKVKGFKYTGYDFDIATGDKLCNEIVEALEKNAEQLSIDTLELKDAGGQAFQVNNSQGQRNSNSPDPADNAIQKGYNEDNGGNRADYIKAIAGKIGIAWTDDGKSSSDLVDKIITAACKGKISASDSSEMRTELEEKYRDGSAKIEIVDFDGHNSLDAMLKHLEESDKKLSEIEKARKKIERPIDLFIKQLNKFKSEATDDKKKTAESSGISFLASVFTSVLNAIKDCFNIKVQAYKDATAQWLSACKAFYRFRGATTESVVIDADVLGVLENGKSDDEDEPDEDTKSDKSSKKKDENEDTEESEDVEESSVKNILDMARMYSF